MDKKLLSALENLSFALEAIADALEKTKKKGTGSDVAGALASKDLDKKVNLVQKGIEDLKKDNKKILQNQETLLKLAKQKKEESVVSESGDPKKNKKLKEGLGVILAIALGVLAIGLAFKIIGDINFVAVLSLAVALPLIAFAFEKIAEVGERISPKKLFLISVSIALSVSASSYILSTVKPVNLVKLISAMAIAGVLVVLSYGIGQLMEGVSKISLMSMLKLIFLPAIFYSLSLAIAQSSEVLRGVKPVGLLKLFSAIMIAAVFAALGYSLEKIVGSLSKLGIAGIASIVFLPLIFVALSQAIAQSSEHLRGVKPVNLIKLINAIFIAAVFAALGYGLGKILQGFKDLSPKTALVGAILMPIVLVALSWAIAESSVYLQKVKPVNLIKLLTAFMISIVFIPMGFAVVQIAKAMKKVNLAGVILMPIILVVLAAVIYVTSLIFKETETIPFTKLLNILLIAGAISGIAFIFAKVTKMALSKVSLGEVIKGAAILLIVAGTIMLTSWILNQGTYEKYPNLGYALGVGLSLAVFAGAAIALGAAAMTGIGAIAFGVGIPMVLAVAGTIVAVSYILAEGKYEIPGMLEWSIATALLYSTFTPILLVLGAVGMASAVVEFFGGGNPFEMARGMLVDIAWSIVYVSWTLQKGTFTGGPTVEWAGGVALALGAFMPVYSMMMANSLMKIFGGGGVGPKDFNEAITTVIGGIVAAAKELATNTAVFQNGPPKKWAEGVGGAIGAFAPVYSRLVNEGFMKAFGVKGVGIKEFNEAIKVTVQGIVAAATLFGDNKSAFKLGNIPSKKWADGVGGAINAFAPALEFITKNKSFWANVDTSIIEKALKSTAMGIAVSSRIIAEGNYEDKLKQSWVDNTGNALKSFFKLTEEISGMATWQIPQTVSVVTTVTDISKKLNSANFNQTFNPNWVLSLGVFIKMFIALTEWVYSKKGISAALNYFVSGNEYGVGFGGSSVLGSIKRTAEIFDSMKNSMSGLRPGWMMSVDFIVRRFVKLVDWVADRKNLSVSLRNFNSGRYDFGFNYHPSVMGSIMQTAENFRIIGKKMMGLDPAWMINVEMNVKRYVRLARWLTDKNPKLNALGNAVYNMYKIADGYSQLAKGVSKLNTELKKLDVEKLSILKNLTGSIVLMSLMDADQFKKMMDALEKKAKIFVDVMSATDKKKSKEKIKPPIENVKRPSGDSNGAAKTFDDVCILLDAIKTATESSAGNTSEVNKFIEDLRTGTVKIPT